jgi:hypothetical protein
VFDGKQQSLFQTLEVALYKLGTLLLTNQLDKQASELANCHIVPLLWLLESDKAKKPLPESKYSFSQADQTPQADDDTQDKTADDTASPPIDNKRTTRRRGANAASTENDAAKATNDTQKNGTNGKAKSSEDKKPATKKRGADEDPVKKGSNKKTKDIQKTTIKALNVPIDDGFEELGKLKGKSAMRELRCGRKTDTPCDRPQGLH